MTIALTKLGHKLKGYISLSALLRFIAFFLIAAGVSQYFSYINSLLTDYHGYDYTVFRTLAMGWMEGKLPYIDYFDHKGPVVYLFYILGLLISKQKIGIFLIFALVNATTFELVYRCGRVLKTSVLWRYIAVAVSVCYMMYYIDGGGTVEELSLPFQMLGLLAVLKYINNQYESIKVPALINGVCFGIVALIRVNNNTIITGLVIALVVILLIKKENKELYVGILWFLAGLCATVIPFVLYFLYVGGLKQFIYCNLIFNIRYSAVWHEAYTWKEFIAALILNMPCVLVLPIAGYLYPQGKDKSIFILSLGLAIITLLVFGRPGYPHYLQLTLPLIALSILLLSRIKLILGVVLCLGLFIPMWGSNWNIPKSSLSDVQYDKEQDLIKYIPSQERDSILTFGEFTCVHHLTLQDHLPVNKYFFMQNKLSSVDTVVYNEMRSQFVSHLPKWIYSKNPIDSVQMFYDCAMRYDSIAHYKGSGMKEDTYLYRRK